MSTTRGRSGRQHRASSIPADLPGSPFAQALRQPILLGLFLPIQAGGWSASTLERTTDWRWEYNRDLVLKAEALGFDLVFALSQWLPRAAMAACSTATRWTRSRPPPRSPPSPAASC